MVCSTNETPMTNIELTLDQLQAVSGGFMKLGDIKGEYRRIVHPQFRNRIGGTSGPGGTTYLKQNITGSANPGGDDI